jgi:hypothetical protein
MVVVRGSVDTQSCLLWSCLLVQSLLVIWSWDRPLSYCLCWSTPGPRIPIGGTWGDARLGFIVKEVAMVALLAMSSFSTLYARWKWKGCDIGSYALSTVWAMEMDGLNGT